MSFILGSTLLNEWVHTKVSGMDPSSKVRRIFSKINQDKQAWKLALLLRLSPMPSWLNNYGLAITSIPVTHFLVANALGGIPFILQNVYVGSLASDFTSLMSESHAFDNVPSWKQPKTYFMTLAFLASVFLTWRINQYLKDDLDEKSDKPKTSKQTIPMDKLPETEPVDHPEKSQMRQRKLSQKPQ